jgi:hypothetical protein
MLARLNYVLRALRVAGRRRARREPLDLLSAEAVQARMLRVRRAVGTAALLGAAGWVMLGDLPRASFVGWGERAAEPQRLRAALGFADAHRQPTNTANTANTAGSPHPTWRAPPSRCRRPPVMV